MKTIAIAILALTLAATSASANAAVSDPAYSKDGKLIAFASDMGDYPAKQGIYVMRADGSHLRRVTFLSQAGAYDLQPSFSADGRRIVFTRTRTANGTVLSAVCVTTLSGRKVRRLTPWVAASAP
jgi:Tol biopolymer transport system component